MGAHPLKSGEPARDFVEALRHPAAGQVRKESPLLIESLGLRWLFFNIFTFSIVLISACIVMHIWDPTSAATSARVICTTLVVNLCTLMCIGMLEWVRRQSKLDPPREEPQPAPADDL